MENTTEPEKKVNNNSMLDSENGENSENRKKSCIKTNYTNYSNLTNYTNYSNIISILGNPKDKAEAVHFLLYCEPDSDIKRVLEISGLSQNAFYNLKSRDINIISKKLGQGNVAVYDITPELREQISLRIQQKHKLLESETTQKQTKKQELQTQEDILFKFKTAIQEKGLISFDNGYTYVNLIMLKELYPELFERLITKPDETKQILELSLAEHFDNYKIKLRFKELSALNPRTIDSLRSKDLNQLVLIEAKSTTLSDVRPQVVNIKYECPSCGTIISILQLEKKIRQPSRCTCGRRGGFKELSSDMVDTAKVTLEDMKDLTESPSLKVLKGFIKEPLTSQEVINRFNPGTDLRILGVLVPVSQQTQTGTLTRFDIALEILEAEEFEPEIDLNSFTEEEITQYKQIAEDINKNGLARLIKSIAPSVAGNETIKEALTIQVSQSRNKKSEVRNNPNILIIGDPGVSKSVIAKFMHKTTTGSSYVSGSGASQVGLTAVAEKQEDSWILKPGVLPTTRVLAVIDEFNLIGEEEIPKLQEAMSEQQITINKASIHTKLRVSCGILAIANPISGVFYE